jgi:hypothetical protein
VAFLSPPRIHVGTTYHQTRLLADTDPTLCSNEKMWRVRLMQSMLKSLSALAATLRSCAGDLSLTMATLASVTSSMASLRRQRCADMCQPGRVPLASAAGNDTHGTADLAKANPEKGQVHGRGGRKRRERGSQAVHAALDEMQDVFLRQLEALLGTLSTLRMLMNLVPARAYVVKAEGAGAVASFRLSFLSIMSRSIDALHSLPHLADSLGRATRVAMAVAWKPVCGMRSRRQQVWPRSQAS